jgi:hypothetical protein
MNGTFKKSLIAVAITAVFSTATVAVAQSTDQNSTSSSTVQFNKKLKLKTNINVSGDPTVSGNIAIDSAAIAIVDNKQSNGANVGINNMLTNDASAADTVLGGSSGNIGLNIGAGDNNQQDNAAALSAADASFAFGMADGEVFVNQQGTLNQTANVGVTNNSSIGGDAFNGASGNIGANITSGNNNQQKNAMAASVATNNYAQSSISSNQASGGNTTGNVPFQDVQYTSVDVTLSGSGGGTYSGNSTGNANLGLTGAVDQIGNVYPDVWNNNPTDDPTQAHPGTTLQGHIDLNTDTQGGSDLNGDGGALAFGYTSNSAANGPVTLAEQGDLALNNITLSGTVQYMQNLYYPTTNTASLSGTAFNGASGNIGINISAGTGNQQANSLALAVAQPSTGGGGTPPPTPGEQ